MGIYTLKKQKLKKNSPNVPKLGVSGLKDTAKFTGTQKIQVEYSVFFSLVALL